MFLADFRIYRDKMLYNLSLLREIFYPRQCAVCGNVIDTGCFCASCRKSFLLQKVIRDAEPLQEVFLLYKYEQQLKEMLHRVKFDGERSLLPLLQEEAKQALPAGIEYFFADYDIVAGIPTSPERRERRGFDVPERIFSFSVVKYQQILIRLRNTLPLYELEPALRREELQGCFKVCSSVTDKKILLCDDIYTTGSTMREAAIALYAAGAASVSALAFSASKDNW